MIGIKVERFKNDINIYGNPNLTLSGNYEIKNYLKDHRIFFLSCIAALTLGGKWKINDKDSINTSNPSFLKTLKTIGAKFNWKEKNIITVAIDSPAAAGAGTQAKLISKYYNLFYLDTGKYIDT